MRQYVSVIKFYHYSMSKYSPNQKLPQREGELSDVKRLEKSKTQLQVLQRTPSMNQTNPYLDNMDWKGTEKKRRDNSEPYAPPILLEQNRQLMSENREMAMLIHEKNRMIEVLEKKYNDKLERQVQFFKEVEADKQRFIADILKRKEQNDAQTAQLIAHINKLQDEKSALERQFNIDLKKERLHAEEDRKRDAEQLTIQYQQNLAISNSQRLKYKEQAEQKANQIKIIELEHKQKIDEQLHEKNKLKEDLKHLQHVKKLQQSELKHFYENKIQKIHLDNRRDKQVFLIQHESQVKKNQQVIRKLKEEIMNLQSKIEQKQVEIDGQKTQSVDSREKMQYELESITTQIREHTYMERLKIQQLYKAEAKCQQSSSNEEIKQLLTENAKMVEICQLKKAEITKLYGEIDQLRQRHIVELQDNENVIKQLQSKLFTNQILSIEESQVMKIKLSNLREADLRTLRQYYEHQIQALTESVHDKEAALILSRQKYHQQLRQKSQIRKYFEIEVIKYKAQIMALQRQIKELTAQLEADRKQQQQREEAGQQEQHRQERLKNKVQYLKNDQWKQMQLIINSKDQEIQEIERKIRLLKEHHQSELQQKDKDIECQKQKYDLLASEKQKESEYFQNEIRKLKDLLKKEKAEFESEIQAANQQRKNEVDRCLSQLLEQKERAEQEMRNQKKQNKKMNLQITRLNAIIVQKDKQIYVLREESKKQLVNESKRQRQLLEQFYKEQLRVKDAEILDLNERVEELSNDLRDARENYNDLEKRLEQLIQSQSTLRELQRKVMNMGMENNHVKNLKEAAR